jgi:hypothetical protein
LSAKEWSLIKVLQKVLLIEVMAVCPVWLADVKGVVGQLTHVL